jgi:hypothetical protein
MEEAEKEEKGKKKGESNHMEEEGFPEDEPPLLAMP